MLLCQHLWITWGAQSLPTRYGLHLQQNPNGQCRGAPKHHVMQLTLAVFLKGLSLASLMLISSSMLDCARFYMDSPLPDKPPKAVSCSSSYVYDPSANLWTSIEPLLYRRLVLASSPISHTFTSDCWPFTLGVYALVF